MTPFVSYENSSPEWLNQLLPWVGIGLVVILLILWVLIFFKAQKGARFEIGMGATASFMFVGAIVSALTITSIQTTHNIETGTVKLEKAGVTEISFNDEDQVFTGTFKGQTFIGLMVPVSGNTIIIVQSKS